MSEDKKFKVKDFVSNAVELLLANQSTGYSIGQILVIPIVFHLFEGLGRSDGFVKKCEQGLNGIPGAKKCLRDDYIMKVFPNDDISNAFIDHYAYLNTVTINFLTTAYQRFPGVE